MIKDKVTLRLTLNISYETNYVGIETLVFLMESAVLHAMEHGLITGSTEAEVTTWDMDITEL